MAKRVPAVINGYGLKSTYGKKAKDSKMAPSFSAGEYYGSGVRNPTGTLVYDSITGESGKPDIRKPPRSLA